MAPAWAIEPESVLETKQKTLAEKDGSKKVPLTKPDDLNSISKTHLVEGEN